MKKIITILIGLTCLALALTVEPIRNELNHIVLLLSSMDVDKIKTYILSFGLLAPLISFLLMIFQSLAAPLPAFLITFANANLFGWIKGALLSWSSALTGAIICFFIARLLGRQFVEKLTSRYALNNIDEFFEKHGKHAVLIARLLPFISFDIVSYAAGLTSMSLKSFIIATGLGQLPATLIYSYVGQMLTGGLKHLVFALMILFSLSILIWLIKSMMKNKENTTEVIRDENKIT